MLPRNCRVQGWRYNTLLSLGSANDEGNAKFYYKSDAYPDGTTFSVTNH